MTAPNMGTITESLERSFQNCSLNSHPHQRRRSGINEEGSREDSGQGLGRSSSSDDDHHHQNHNNSISSNLQNGDAVLELNSHVSLPYHWEQCLDLKTGEIYYINWRNGKKAKEDPRTAAESSGDFYYSDDEEEEEDDEDDDDDSSYDSEESTSESSPACSSSKPPQYNNNHRSAVEYNGNVLVVAGCKGCLMYFMVPKQVEDCPKCNGQLLHFDRSENGFP